MFKKLEKKYTENKDKNNFSVRQLLKDGFFSGFGWSFGVTVGFVVISIVVVNVLKMLGGLPVVGGFIANVVDATQAQLERKIR